MSASSIESGYHSTGEEHRQQPLMNLKKIEQDSKRLEKDFCVQNHLMKSANGEIYDGFDRKTRRSLIFKQIPRATVPSWHRMDGYWVPSEIYYHFHAAAHDFDNVIVKPFTWLEKRSSFVLVMEKINNCCDLFDFVKHNGTVTEYFASKITKQLIAMLKTLKRAGISHRDFKDENIIIDLDTLKLKLIDFGCATIDTEENQFIFSGTPEFYPPEYWRQRVYTHSTLNIWSVGIIIYIVLNGSLPFPSIQAIPYFNIQHKLESMSSPISAELRNMLNSILHSSPSKRASLSKFEELFLIWERQVHA